MSIRRPAGRRTGGRTTVTALALAAALALSGCGSSGDDAGDKAAQSKKKAAAQGGDEFADAAEKTAEFGTDAKAGEWPRTVTHAMGETEIKTEPERVVVLDVGELDNVVSLGVKPVGLAPTEGSNKLPGYLAKQAGDPKSAGTINNLNLEVIAELRPDLILGSQLRAADKYKQLSKIAPTVFSIRPGTSWKENFLLNAAALDRSAEARKQLDAYEKKAEKLGTDLGEDKPTVTMLRYLPDRIRLYGKQSFIGVILDDVGVPRPKNQQVDDLATEISAERIDEADADWIFIGTYGDPKATDRSTVENAGSNGLWKNLDAVRNGQAKDVNEETWYLGLGVTAADEVLDDLRSYLLK